ncbi:unnamed protein product [Linum tenue]|uniref:Major facilitator superfamily (MFS) profile domain-containing protein n=1 Tax=Linum tenue TaxID=586396 RepID=A0AAV0LQ22_9ROSI|nr:unnamed protein product [Linum tenue]
MASKSPSRSSSVGINVIAFYAPLLFRTIGMGERASLMSAILTGAVGIGTAFLSMVIVDRVGRRPLFLFGGVLMFVSQMTHPPLPVVAASSLCRHRQSRRNLNAAPDSFRFSPNYFQISVHINPPESLSPPPPSPLPRLHFSPSSDSGRAVE